MDKSKSSSQPSSLDSLRTVEFRQTLRGYHIEDVDEYLERVAVDAEALQEQLRQSGERIKQAADRITLLERQASQAPPPAAAAPGASADETLQRTLVLAQKFVEQTHIDAESEARTLVTEAEQRAKSMVDEAEESVRTLTEESERKLREDIARLESTRSKLASDVETIARHLDGERARLRESLSKMLSWVDEHIQPSNSLLAQHAESRKEGEPSAADTGADRGPGQGSLLRTPSPGFSGRSEGQGGPGGPAPNRPTTPQSSNPQPANTPTGA